MTHFFLSYIDVLKCSVESTVLVNLNSNSIIQKKKKSFGQLTVHVSPFSLVLSRPSPLEILHIENFLV